MRPEYSRACIHSRRQEAHRNICFGRRKYVIVSIMMVINCYLVKTLLYFNEYYGIPYPLPKMDMVAIADFAAGAME